MGLIVEVYLSMRPRERIWRELGGPQCSSDEVVYEYPGGNLVDSCPPAASFLASGSYTTGSFTGVRVIPGCCFRRQEGVLKTLWHGHLAIKISQIL